MPTINITAQLSTTDLLHAVEQLPGDELESFVAQVITYRARRNAPSLPHEEAELLERINMSLPEATLDRYRELIALRREERLTPEEHTELLAISDALETLHVQRMEDLIKLAAVRGVSLTRLVDDLGIKPLEV